MEEEEGAAEIERLGRGGRRRERGATEPGVGSQAPPRTAVEYAVATTIVSYPPPCAVGGRSPLLLLLAVEFSLGSLLSLAQSFSPCLCPLPLSPVLHVAQ